MRIKVDHDMRGSKVNFKILLLCRSIRLSQHGVALDVTPDFIITLFKYYNLLFYSV